VDLEAALGRMKTPVLAISLEGDPFAPPRAVRYLCDKLVSARVRHLHLGRQEMPAAGRHHFRWVQHADPIVGHIRRWIDPNT
jgi:predicted alpha/beta hydrolase